MENDDISLVRLLWLSVQIPLDELFIDVQLGIIVYCILQHRKCDHIRSINIFLNSYIKQMEMNRVSANNSALYRFYKAWNSLRQQQVPGRSMRYKISSN